MELYNTLINETRELLVGRESVSWAPSAPWKDTGSAELVLQKDAAFELGARNKGSANYVLYTSNPDLIDKDEIVLYGPDITDVKGDCDFARIVLVRVGVLDGEDENVYRILKDIEFAKYHVYPEGYMVRMSPETYREQIRVSKTAIRKEINFRAIGTNYIESYKKNPNVLNVKVIFVTAPGFDYEEMKKVAKKSADVTNTLTHILEGLSTDCTVCALKDICDEVEGMKELHFGVGDKGNAHSH